MLIRIDDPTLVDDLCAHFRRSAFVAEAVGGGMVEVTRPDVADPVQADRHIAMHLDVWRITNPDCEAEIVG
jgi:hypothetical protein